MDVLPMFTRELRSARHNDRLRHDRLVTAGVTALVLLVLAGIDRWGEGINVVRLLKSVPLAALAPYPLLVVGLSLGVKLLSFEQREGALPLLLMTRLTGHDILLGKLLTALVTELNTLLAAMPALVLPLLMAGCTWREIWLTALGCMNVIFFGLGLGLCAAVFLEAEKAMLWSFVLAFPFLLLATPVGVLVPNGRAAEILAGLQLFNPGQSLAHVQTVAAGIRPGNYWTPLLLSQLLAWALVVVGGYFLSPASRWKESRDLGRRRRTTWPAGKPQNRSAAFRTRLLDRNPFLWLTARSPWPTVHSWAWLVMSAAFWGWLAWWGSIVRGININIVLVIGLAVSWMTQFVVTVPAEASRRLVEDRQSGALEMLLCTPLPVARIIRGQWWSLARRYLAPLTVAMILSFGLMIAGYVTYGFGGMLDAEDRSQWLFVWLAGIGLLPLVLTALCWVALGRALSARNVGEISAVALLQVVALPCFVLLPIPMLMHALFGWNLDRGWSGGMFVVVFGLTQLAFAWRVRAIVCSGLREAAASRYLPPGRGASAALKRLRVGWQPTGP